MAPLRNLAEIVLLSMQLCFSAITRKKTFVTSNEMSQDRGFFARDGGKPK